MRDPGVGILLANSKNKILGANPRKQEKRAETENEIREEGRDQVCSLLVQQDITVVVGNCVLLKTSTHMYSNTYDQGSNTTQSTFKYV